MLMQLNVIDNMDKIKIDLFNTGLVIPLLTVLFIGLKLTNYITWSWLWVLSPLWIPTIVFIFILLVFFILFLIFDRV